MGDPVGPQWEILSDHSGFSEVIRNMIGPSPCRTAVDSNCVMHFFSFSYNKIIIGQENETKPNKTITVEPPNKGHFGNGTFVLSSEVVLISEVHEIF